MILIGILIGVLVTLGILLQGLSMVLAGRMTRTSGLGFKRGIEIALLWLGLNLVCLLVQAFFKEPLVDTLAGIISVLGSIYIVQRILGLKVLKAIGVSVVGYLIAIVLLVGLLALPVRAFYLQAFKIPGTSMSPTLLIGDRVLVNKLTYRLREPHRWDLVVYRSPNDPSLIFLKRIVALPGETVEIRDGDIWVNGAKLSPPFKLSGIRWENGGQYGQPGKPVQVPAVSYFLVGDSGKSGRDSRYMGPIHRQYLVGKPAYIYWPVGRRGEVR